MFHSIRWRIAFPYILLILVAMLAIGLYLSNFIRQSYQSELETQLSTQAKMIGETLGTALLPGQIDPQQLDLAAQKWKPILNARVTLITLDGVVIGESDEDRTQMNNHSDRPEIIQALAEGRGSSVRFSHTVGYDMLYTAVLFPTPQEPEAIIRLAVPLDRVDANVQRLQSILLTATLIVMLLTIVLAAWIAGRTTRPVQQLTLAIRQMTASDLSEQAFSPPLTKSASLPRPLTP